MANLAIVVMLAGYVWGVAAMVGFPGVSWKPGAALTVGSALWLVGHDAMPPEPLIEAAAIIIFLALLAIQKRRYPPSRAKKPPTPGTE